MIRVLAKLWNRRYIVLSVVVVLLFTLFLLPGKEETQTDTLENSSLSDVSEEEPVLIMYTNTDVTLYAKPKTDAKEVSVVAEGTAIENLKPAKDGWYSAEYNDKKVYVQGEFLVEEYIIETEPTVPPTEPPFEPYWTDDGKWLIVDEQVRAEGNVCLRDKPGGEKLLLIEARDEIHRSQIGVNGWSKVTSMDGTEGYISTFYLMPVERVTYEEVEEYVIVTEDSRVRASGSINSEQVGWAIKGDQYVRVGISQHGWSQILYKGKVQYIFSNYIQAITGDVDPADLGNYLAPSKGGSIE